ncbi:hypothetical protein DMC63_03705 [Streptomyces sp. WAC 05977]|nr:hypothetical protein DMC63_03705 [Streptomyces sp. WAC 05977]
MHRRHRLTPAFRPLDAVLARAATASRGRNAGCRLAAGRYRPHLHRPDRHEPLLAALRTGPGTGPARAPITTACPSPRARSTLNRTLRACAARPLRIR